MRWNAALGVVAGGGRDGPVFPTFREGGVFQEEDGLEAAPLCGNQNSTPAGRGSGKQGRGEGWSVTKDGDHLCVCAGRGEAEDRWGLDSHCLANQD